MGFALVLLKSTVLLTSTVPLLSAGFEYQSSAYLNGEYASAAVDDSLIYIADGRGVSVFSTARFQRLGGCYLPGTTQELVRYGEDFYAAGSRGVMKVSAAEVLDDRPAYSLIHPGDITALTLSGDTLWFADARSGLYAWNVSEEAYVADPVELGAPVVRIVPGEDRILLAADTAGLWAVDLKKNPWSPDRLDIEDDPAVMDVVLKGELAYLACAERGLWSVELRRRSLKVLARAEVSGEVLRLEEFGEHLAGAAGVGDFLLFTLEDPRDPQVVEHIQVPGSAIELARAGRMCLVIFSTGFRKLDLSRFPAGGGLTYNNRGTGWEVLVRGQVGVLAAGDAGVKTFSVQPDGSVDLLGTYSDAADCRGVRLFGTQVFALPTGNRMHVVNITDPEVPAKKTFVDFNNVISGLDSNGEMALVAEQAHGLGAWWRCPCGPLKEQGRLHFGANVQDVQVSEKLAFLSTSHPALYVVDYSDSTRMEQVSNIELAHTFRRLYLVGNNLIGLDSTGYLGVMNVSRASRPRMLGGVELAGTPYGLIIDGERAYVAAGEAGVHVVDLGNPGSPTLVKTLDVTPARGVALAGQVLVVSTPWSLETYKITPVTQ